jgi:hypothetical protein
MHIKVDITSSTPILSLSGLDIQANTFKTLMKVNFLAIRSTPFLHQPFYTSLGNICSSINISHIPYYFKLIEFATMQVLGSMEVERIFSTLFFMKNKL